MRKILLLALLAATRFASATPLVVEDFESYAVGTKWTVWDRYGSGSTTATVTADPKNSKNHVLHVQVKSWNSFPEFIVPSEYSGVKLKQYFKTVRFRFYRPSADTNDYKQLHIFWGDDQMYADNSYPYQGDKLTWQDRSYNIANISDGSTANQLRLGIHCDVSDYYLDDITLVGAYDDYVTVESGLVDICSKNTSSSYAVYSTPTFIPEAASLEVRTSRYTDFNAPFAGTGTLNLYSGGERTFLGEHTNRSYPDWTEFSGDVHIYKYNKVEGSAGFYGVVMAHNGKTFSPEDSEEGIKSGKVCNMLANNRVTLHNGAAIAFENGTRGAQYGQLNTEAGSRIYGYYKASAGTGAYLLVGSDNTDATMAGRIAPMEKDGKPLLTCLVGITKMGSGTYTLTANDNVISGSIRVLDGRVDICNDAAKAKSGKFTGGTGTPANGASAVRVMGKGVLGGTGSIAGGVDVYGVLEPGTASLPGKLTLQDYATSSSVNLNLHPEGTLRFKISSKESFDQLYVSNSIVLSNIKEDFCTSTDAPRIKIVLDALATLAVGDEFLLIDAANRQKADAWNWNISLPTRLSWKVEERNVGGRYNLVAVVTGLDGNDNDDDNNDDDDNDDDDDGTWADLTDVTFKSDGDSHALRYYADQQSLRIGVAVPPSRLSIDNASDASTQIITKQFNMVVPENELKWDWVEPSQNSFNYGDGDRLYTLAKNNKLYMRGHTLAWHSQVASWVSSDGKKNDKNWTKEQLMAILKNHVTNVVKHYKGKIGEWDVVNECLDDDQSIVRNDPNGYKLRAQSVWTTVCGEAFIDSAFVWARQADPTVRLYLNDYGNEFMGNAKAQAFYNLAKRLKESGAPIDGVGFQCHLDAGDVDYKALKKNLERYAALGLECAITELDMGVSSTTESEWQQQARDYYRVVEAAMSVPHCKSVLIWGVSDNMSWRSSSPLIYDSSLQRKAAYWAVKRALSNVKDSSDPETEVQAVDVDASSSDVYYDLSGRALVGAPLASGLYIRGGRKFLYKSK